MGQLLFLRSRLFPVFCAAMWCGTAGCGSRTALRIPDAMLLDQPPAMDVVEEDAVLDVQSEPEVQLFCLRAGMTAWQVNFGRGPFCFGRSFTEHGDPAEFAFEPIPAAGDPGWRARASMSIDFDDPSTLCDGPCTCRDGGDFTFFQTFFDLPAGFQVRSFEVEIASVDDGARVTLFNSAFPGGTNDPSTFVQLGRGIRLRLERFLIPGRNRLVISHVDDCCSDRSLSGVRVLLNGGELVQCR